MLGFPFIFRGALDVYASQINEEMKMAASQALAQLAHEDVPDSVLNAYGLSALKFGRDYLIPKPFDPRVLLYVAPAVAKAAMESGVARRQLDLDEYRHALLARQGHSHQVRDSIISRARSSRRKHRIAFSEGEETKIIRAAYIVQEEGLGEPILMGQRATIHEQIQELGLNFAPRIVDPATDTQRGRYVEALHMLRVRKGVTHRVANGMLRSRSYYGPMMVHMGDADVFISGITAEYPQVLRPALQVVGTREGVNYASGVYIVIIKQRVYFFTDATVNIDPDAEALAEIAILTADFARGLSIEPKVAMLSFSNFGSAPHPASNKVRDAVQIIKKKRPNITVDGEMQADTAVVASIIEDRYPISEVKDANVLVFPDLGSANIAYKLLARLGSAETIGPILLGMGKPVQVLQAGDDVEDIVATVAAAVTEAEDRYANGVLV